MAKQFQFLLLVGVLLVVCVECGKVVTDSKEEHAINRPASEENKSPGELRASVKSNNLKSTEWKSLKRSKHLTYLFRKYGSGGLITFEVSSL